MRRILVAVDGSPLSFTVIRRAYELTEILGAELTILSVLSSDPMRKISTSDEEKKLRELHRELISGLFPSSKIKLEPGPGHDTIFGLGASGDVKIQSRIGAGDPVDRICRDADEIGADLIVIGNRGLGNIGTLILGSISEKVVRKSSRSVLVVKDSTVESANWEKVSTPHRAGQHRF